MRRQQKPRRRQPQKAVYGWRSYSSSWAAKAAARTYFARCRPDFRPNEFYVLTQTEGGAPRHYPVLVVRDPEARVLHATHSGFKVV